LGLAVVLVAGLFATRLFFLQVVRAEHYREEADRQYLKTNRDIFERGDILAIKHDGTTFSLAGVKTAYVVAVNPKLLQDPIDTYERLKLLLELDRDQFMLKVAKPEIVYTEIATKVDQAVAEEIKALRLEGVILSKQKLRSYPFGHTASHTIGFVGYRGDEVAGRYGLESYYESVLSRREEVTFANFFVEIFSGLKNSLLVDAPSGRGDIVTTIEPITQKLLEKELLAARELWDAEAAGGIIIDPRNGEILALEAWPNFNPGERQADAAVLTHPLIEKTYEMGSIVKPLTMAAALDAGVVNQRTTYNDRGCVVLSTKKICNYDSKARGTVVIQEILNQSLNVGIVFLTQKLGADKLRDYFLAFGFGERTGIDLPNEAKNLTNNLDSHYEVDLATAGFGQGITLTPISITRALSVLANGGHLIQPHLVKKINYENTLSQTIESKPGPQVIKPATAEEITRMLVRVVDEKIPKVKMDHYAIAAKTGTAQMIDPITKSYYDDRFIHSWFGYFPAYEPRFLVFMYLVNPRGVQYASQSLTEPFVNISRSLLNYYQVPPDR